MESVQLSGSHAKYLTYLRKTFTRAAMEKRQQLRLSGQLNAPIRKRKRR